MCQEDPLQPGSHHCHPKELEANLWIKYCDNVSETPFLPVPGFPLGFVYIDLCLFYIYDRFPLNDKQYIMMSLRIVYCSALLGHVTIALRRNLLHCCITEDLSACHSHRVPQDRSQIEGRIRASHASCVLSTKKWIGRLLVNPVRFLALNKRLPRVT